MVLALGFLNPLFLWALPIAAVPIVIHLLNRRRFEKRRWAAMEFLLRAMKRNRRRLRMEQWLVLLLRTLAVILLVLLVSRPQLASGAFGTVRTHHVVVVDDSPSMAHRGGADDAFDRAKDSVQRLVTRLSSERAGDFMTLVRSSAPDKPAFASAPVGPSLGPRVRDALVSWTVGDSVLDAGRVLESVRNRAQQNEDAGELEFYVVTDLRRHDWTEDDGGADAAVVKWLESLDEDAEHLEVVGVGARDRENVAVNDVRCANRICLAGVPLTIEINLVNHGTSTSDPTELTLTVNDADRVPQPVPPIEPGTTATIQFTRTFHSAGAQALVASLPGDRFTVDDTRALVIDVRPASRVLLVDGDPGEDLESSETFFLNVCLDPGGDTVTGIDVVTIADHELATLPEDEFAEVDMVFLCNVSRPDDASVARLEEFARRGGGIVFFLGNQIDSARYNAVLHRDGAGLLPVPLSDAGGDMDDPHPIHVAAVDHDLFANSTEEFVEIFAQLVLVGRWIEQEVGPGAAAATLLRVKDSDGPPLMTGHTFEDGGRVFVVGTSADAHWNNMAVWPALLMLVNELHGHAARPQDYSRHNLLPDGVFVIDVDPGVHRPDVTVADQDGSGDTRTFAAPSTGGDVVSLRIPMAELDGTGVFEVQRRRHGGERDSTRLARNPFRIESDLTPIGAREITDVLPEGVRDRVTVRDTAGSGSRDLMGAGGIWRWLGLLMIAGMLLETLLAWRFGRR